LLAHSHRVEGTIGMFTLCGVNLTAESFIARGTHVFGIVLPIGVWTVGDGF
jgi:hypothetical protein